MKTLSPAVIALPWRQDVAEFYFSRLSHLPRAMFLHSGYADHPYSHFDIVVADSICIITTFGEETVVGESEERTMATDNPLRVLQQVLGRTDIRPTYNEDLPFQGGALGLFGYGLGCRFEPLPEVAGQNIVLPDMTMGIYGWTLIVGHQRHTASLLSHNDVNVRRAWLEGQQFSPQKGLTLTLDWQSDMTREQYGEKFRQVQEYLHNGDCYQANLAQRFRATYPGDEQQAFLQLDRTSRALFSAFLHLEQGATLSLSSERFILRDNSEIQTCPIKDTLPRLPDPQESNKQTEGLTNSVKGHARNLMIVDLMRNDIGRVAVAGSVKVPELFVVEPFSAVHHLINTIAVRLPEQLRASDLLRATFPGSSIAGAPKVRTMEIIDELGPQQRDAWYDSIGYLSFYSSMGASITIRTLTATNGRIYCSTGDGAVADSQEEAEYQETFDKVNKILRQPER